MQFEAPELLRCEAPVPHSMGAVAPKSYAERSKRGIKGTCECNLAKCGPAQLAAQLATAWNSQSAYRANHHDQRPASGEVRCRIRSGDNGRCLT
jgi:hypothetical protein